jgi:hypothetical protein
MGYFKNLYSTELENVKEMDEILDSAKPPKLNQEKINNGNKSIRNEDIEIIIKSIPA